MAKGIVKKTEKAAKKQLKQEGAFKGLSRKERIALSKKKAFETRNWVRGQMAEGREAKAVKKSASDAKKREAARTSGQRLAYDVGSKGRYQGTPSEVMQGIRRTSGSFGSTEDKTPTSLSMAEGAANRKNRAATKPGDTYELILPNGTKKTVRKPIAKHGAKVKAVKKAKK